MLEFAKIYFKEIEPNERGEKYSLGIEYLYNGELYGRIYKCKDCPSVETVVDVLNIMFNQQIKGHLEEEDGKKE
jgi:hypothetical protein